VVGGRKKQHEDFDEVRYLNDDSKAVPEHLPLYHVGTASITRKTVFQMVSHVAPALFVSTMAVGCIPSNPDVSGIGVRAAIYAQNLTCFLPVIVHLWDRKISRDELKGIKDQSISMLAVAFAILLTTIILAKDAGGDQTITSYHAAVVLDLSWMNNTSTWIWFILYVHHRSKHDSQPTGANWTEWRDALLEPLWESLGQNAGAGDSTGTGIWGITQHIWCIAQCIWHFISEQPVLTLGSIHLSLMATVGIWLWSDPSKFGQPLNPSCDPTLTVIGVAAQFASKPLRIASLTMYFLVLIPGLNLIPPFVFFLTLHISYNWCSGQHQSYWTWWDKAVEQRRPRSSPGDSHNQMDVTVAYSPSISAVSQPRTPHTAFLIVGLVLLVAINILFIVDIELTLHRNKGNQNGDEAAWGFGQVLALLLLIIPLRDAWRALQDIREKLKGIQEQFEELLLHECQAMPVVEELRRLIQKGANPNLWSADIRFGNALQLVAYYGKVEVVNALLQAGASLNVEGECVDANGMDN
jgi:hypothetical protein